MKHYSKYVLAGDIGGTNSTMGLFGVSSGRNDLLGTLSYSTRNIPNIKFLIEDCRAQFLKSHKLDADLVSLAVAGPVSADHQYTKLTNVNLEADAKRLSKSCGLDVLLLNDFEAIGYAVAENKIKDSICLKKGKKAHGNMIVVGAGTGLGKVMIAYDQDRYIVMPSEAGHTDFAPVNSFEMELQEFVKETNRIRGAVDWEHLLSGRGLTNIYEFLHVSKGFHATKYTSDVDSQGGSPELISLYKHKDKTCKKTFSVFSSIYARFVRNQALDSLSVGGVYIAGGIAVKNPEMFDQKFVKAFIANRAQSNLLRDIPIHLVTDIRAGLLGAGVAGRNHISLL